MSLTLHIRRRECRTLLPSARRELGPDDPCVSKVHACCERRCVRCDGRLGQVGYTRRGTIGISSCSQLSSDESLSADHQKLGLTSRTSEVLAAAPEASLDPALEVDGVRRYGTLLLTADERADEAGVVRNRYGLDEVLHGCRHGVVWCYAVNREEQ